MSLITPLSIERSHKQAIEVKTDHLRERHNVVGFEILSPPDRKGTRPGWDAEKRRTRSWIFSTGWDRRGTWNMALPIRFVLEI